MRTREEIDSLINDARHSDNQTGYTGIIAQNLAAVAYILLDIRDLLQNPPVEIINKHSPEEVGV